jgi:hypothetical protein
MKVLALAGYDSFLNTAKLIAPFFMSRGAEVDFSLVKARKKKQIDPAQIVSLGFSKPIQYIDIKKICENGEINQYDVVLACLEGLSTRRLFHYIKEYTEKRPYIICVYPGLVLRYAFDGFAMRCQADQVWLNCRRDLALYTSMCDAFNVDSSNGKLFGNASLLNKIDRNTNEKLKGPIVFFEQAIIPRHYEERTYLLSQLCHIAERYPDREVIVKVRTVGAQETLHQSWYAMDDIFEEKRRNREGLPVNIKITSESASSLLQRASSCITISSTVAVEAIHAGVPTTIISDFGAHDDYGLQYFYDSGIVKRFEDFDLDSQKPPSKSWIDSHMCDPNLNIEELVCSVYEEIQNKNIKKINQNYCMGSFQLQEFIEEKGENYFVEQIYKKRKRKISWFRLKK